MYEFSRWTYFQYKQAVRSAVDFSMKTHGFSASQAISFAHVDLLVRLDEYPSEIALALCALASEANAMNVLDQNRMSDLFIEEVTQQLQPSLLRELQRHLPAADGEAFARDASEVRRTLSCIKATS